MFEKILRQMREKIQVQSYVMTIHAEEEMSEDGYTISDVENGIHSGAIIERQQDTYNTDEWKYVIFGELLTDSLLSLWRKLPSLTNLSLLRYIDHERA